MSYRLVAKRGMYIKGYAINEELDMVKISEVMYTARICCLAQWAQ